MRPTRLSVLLGLALAVLVVSVGITRALDAYGLLPIVPRSAPVTLLFLAAVVLGAGVSFRSRLRQLRERVPGARPVNPLMAARAAVLAKASSLVGAVVAGWYGGYALHLLTDLQAAGRREQAVICAISAASALLLVAAALFLERVLRLPPTPPEELEEDQEPEPPIPHP
ncbi:DUF3180 domain-containing protein [Carbonactinospora thermoautotrophica]|uniref:DUF3180 domain-containing protein n=1 Tax=Carbonactinospora thermoautotrophica TaxID=1469144 RepID=UPI00083289FD|nr:DUF3180 domain-containing protein [Carbonactinospora thermoautotrophica]MCX9191470.1 DUF3180 domain-containing protein [Carbonactinospora thermoautotrophica]